MMKEAVRALETGLLAEIGLVAFLVAFVLIVIYAMTMKKQTREDMKNMPINEPDEFVLSNLNNGTTA